MSEMDDFDLDRSTRQAWEAFTERLDEVLSVMDSSSDLTISVVRSQTGLEPPSIRYSVTEPGIVQATLSCNPADGLSDLGWVGTEAGRYTLTADQEDTASLAGLTVETLSKALDVLHPVFLQPDQLEEILNPDGAAHPHPIMEQPPVLVPTGRESLDNFIEQELHEIIGHPPLRNTQGDFAVRVGSTVVFLRSTADFKEVVLFSPLVHDVAGRSRAVEVLNDLNVEARYCRFALHRDRVYVQISVFARPFVPAHLKQALQDISQIADGIDEELAARLSGRTTYPG